MTYMKIPCEFYDRGECRVAALFDGETGEKLRDRGCRWEIRDDPTREHVLGCRLRSLGLGEALEPTPVGEAVDNPEKPVPEWEVRLCECGMYSLHKCGRWAHRWYRDGQWQAVFVKDDAKPCRCGQSLARVEAQP